MTKPEEIKSKPRGRLKLRGFRSKLGEQFSIFYIKMKIMKVNLTLMFLTILGKQFSVTKC